MGQVADFVLARLRERGVHRVHGHPGDGDAELDHQSVVAVVGQRKRISRGARHPQPVPPIHQAVLTLLDNRTAPRPLDRYLARTACSAAVTGVTGAGLPAGRARRSTG